MEMRVERLREALQLLQPVVPKKTTLDALKNILLKDGEAAATDLEVTVTLELPEVEGECLIPHHQVLELLKYVPGDEMLTIDSANKAIHLSWRGGKASYDVSGVADYPRLPGVKAKVEAHVDGDRLVKALTSVVQYRATDPARPVLSGVTIAFGADSAEVVAADGFRMAYLTLPMAFPAEETVVMHADAVRVLEHLWQKSPPTVAPGDSLVSLILGKREIGLSLSDDGMICARFGRVTLISRLIKGTPPNFRQLIPSETPMTVHVFAGDLERAVRRLRDVAEHTKEAPIRLTWTESAMTLSAKSDDKRSVEAEIQVKADGGEGRVALNTYYLLEYLKGREGLVTMGVTSPSSPVLFRHGQSPLVLIMPLNVHWGEKPAVVAEAEQVVEEAEEVTEPEEPAEVVPEAEDLADPEEPGVVPEVDDLARHEEPKVVPRKPKRKRKPKG